ncbi:MAG: sigma-70 family RNA polymerase sigma factor [Acidimicrobiales bacterium]
MSEAASTALVDPHDDGDGATDAVLLDAVRGGSAGAFAILYRRHRPTAVAAARRALAPHNRAQAEDVAEVALSAVYDALRRGRGPTTELRGYLVVAVRREAVRQQRRRDREAVVDASVLPAASDPPASPYADPAVRALASSGPNADALDPESLLGEVYRGLSDRFRHALWLSEVEGRTPAELGPLLGITANAAAALCYRARRALRAAYVDVYAATLASPTCKPFTSELASFIEAGQPDEGHDAVRAHLEGCARCREVARGAARSASALAVAAPLAALSAGTWAPVAGSASAPAGRTVGLRRRRLVVGSAAGAAALLLAVVALWPVHGGPASSHRGPGLLPLLAPMSEAERPAPSTQASGPRPAAATTSTTASGASPTTSTTPSAVASTMAAPTSTAPGSPTTGDVRGVLAIDVDGAGPGAARASAGTPIRIVDGEGQVVAARRTDTSGGFPAGPLAPGRYTVVADLPVGLVGGAAGGSPAAPPSARRPVTVGEVEVVAGRVARADATFVPQRQLVVEGGAADRASAGVGEVLTWRFQVRSIGASTDGVVATVVVDHPLGTVVALVDGTAPAPCELVPGSRASQLSCRLGRVGSTTVEVAIRLRLDAVTTAGDVVPTLEAHADGAAALAGRARGTAIRVVPAP